MFGMFPRPKSTYITYEWFRMASEQMNTIFSESGALNENYWSNQLFAAFATSMGNVEV
jgi:hypothetical protein